MQSLGVVFGIFKESYKIITSGNENLYKIIPLILTTCFISMINKLASDGLLPETVLNQTSTNTTAATFNQTQQQNGAATFASYINPYSHLFSSESAPFWRLQLDCLIPTLIFKLLYTSAGIYTAACIHTGQEDVSFNKVIMVVVPKAWKRLFFTFFSTFIAFVSFTAVAMLILAIAWTTIFTVISSSAGVMTISLVVFFVMLPGYLAGLVYLMLISQLANVVSVLEEAGGFKAMKKSNQLLKGNMWVAIIIFFFLAIVYCVQQYAFGKLVMYVSSWGMVAVIISQLLPMVFVLIELVSQTVLYCVCKSYHQEKVELDQVDVSDGYASLKTEELQLENFNHV